ncbi:MAG: hypothetical protein Q4G03_12065 [Planctomycetia bacterium]|nr:hypothetical protein [Planctomycetia bacterium]
MKSKYSFLKNSVIAYAGSTPVVLTFWLLITPLACALHSASYAQEKQPDASEALTIDAWPQDGRPLLPRLDAEPLRQVWQAFPDLTQSTRPYTAVDLQLRRQGKQYKGKSLQVQGRLLRAVQTSWGDQTFYDLWVILPDSKRDPIRILAQNAPEGFQCQEKLENDKPYARDLEYRHETINATAIYYRCVAYDAGDDLYAAPTLIALDFTLTAQPSAPSTDARERNLRRAVARQARYFKIVAIIALLLAWLFWRRLRRLWRANLKNRPPRPSSPQKETTDPKALQDALTALDANRPTKTPLIALALALAGALAPSYARANDSDADFWAAFVKRDPQAWREQLANDSDSLLTLSDQSAQRRADVLAVLATAERVLTPTVLKERLPEDLRCLTLGQFVAMAPEKRAEVAPKDDAALCYFIGEATAFETIALNPTEQERVGAEQLYRVILRREDAEEECALYLANLPQTDCARGFLTHNEPYLDKKPVGMRIAGVALNFGRERRENADPIPTAIALQCGWYPKESDLACAGVDLSAYHNVKIYPHSAFARAQTGEERRQIVRAMRWTRDDVEPFYQTLAAVPRLSRNLDANLLREQDVPVIFNRSEAFQGHNVALRGWTRRVNLILLSDPEVIAATGLDHYYQIFFYTQLSQGSPLVLCTPDIPEELPTGGGHGFRYDLELTGVFYKIWAYKNSATTTPGDAEESDDLEDSRASNWSRAPVIIGRVTHVWPSEKNDNAPPLPTQWIYAAFGVLAAAWILLRRIARRPGANSIIPRR